MHRISQAALALAVLSIAAVAGGEPLKVDSQAGNNTMSAVFDAPLGERIMAITNEVGCDLQWDEKAGTMSGTCNVPLDKITVDGDETKSDHFHQWATNKKADPKTCKLEAKFSAVKASKPLVVGEPVTFEGDVPFTICGRASETGKPEHVTGSVILLPPGSFDTKTLRIRAHVEKFNRESYHVGPKWTEGWLARVQGLAKVVTAEGTIDLNLFAAAPKAK